MEGYTLTSTDTLPGFIYGVTHPAFPGYVKIGHTNSPRARLQKYNTGCPHRAYELAFTIFVTDQYAAEQLAFKRLAGSRIHGTEWFAIHPQDAFNLLSGVGRATTTDD